MPTTSWPHATPLPDHHPATTSRPKLGVLLTNLGTPDAPTAWALARYLRQFLSDQRVIKLPRLLWWPILYGAILPFRSRASAQKYQRVWTDGDSPLRTLSVRLANALQHQLSDEAGTKVPVVLGMRYGNPSIQQALGQLEAAGCRSLVVLPLYPQYAESTTASTFDAVAEAFQQARFLPTTHFINHYADHPSFLDALERSLRTYWDQHGGPANTLVCSYHGLPEEALHQGDPYHCFCHKTTRLLAERLRNDPTTAGVDVHMTFQSRFGPKAWLQPYTEPTLVRMANDGVREVDVVCPGFSVDCLETLDEIGVEAREAFEAAGGQRLRYLPCLNDHPDHVNVLADLCRPWLLGG